jgi:hypothetical protein
MLCIPPFALMDKWLAGCAVPGTTLVRPPYDDVLDVLRALVAIVPVDEPWYFAAYPAIVATLANMPGMTATTHFHKHGYFEKRRPFAAGWRGLRLPIPFTELKSRFRMVVGRGRLLAEIERDDFLDLVREMLGSVPVDEAWYQAMYPTANESIRYGRAATAAAHYVATGYFEGSLPADVDVDEGWYFARYEHVRNSLAIGSSISPKDHFLRIGYREGCRPSPP